MRRDSIRIALVSALGLGLSPFAPGTCGTLLGVMLHVGTVTLAPEAFQVPLLILFCLAACVGNNVLTPWAQVYWNHKDPKPIVLDEVAGYLLVPILFHHGELWQVVVWGFLGFRAFDVIKPPPAWQFNKYGTGAWGILMDDIFAGLYTVGGLYVAEWLGPHLGIERWLIS